MRRNPFRKRTANPSQETQLDTSFVAFQPVLLDNPLYRTTADREQVVPTSPAQPEQVMDQRHDEKADPDYDFVADEGARSSAPSNAAYTPSFNPVYGQPPTGTPLRQPPQSQHEGGDDVPSSPCPPYVSVRPLPPDSERPSKQNAGTDIWSPQRGDMRDSVTTSMRYRSGNTKESDNMLYDTSVKRRSAILYHQWDNDQRWRWRCVYISLVILFLTSAGGIGLAVKLQMEGCSCVTDPIQGGVQSPRQEQPTTAALRSSSLQQQVDTINLTLNERINQLGSILAGQDVQVVDALALINSVNKSLNMQIQELGSVVGPRGPAGPAGPQGKPGVNGSRGLPGISNCQSRREICSSQTTVSRKCTTGTLAPTLGYVISGMTCSPNTMEATATLEVTSVNKETAYVCQCSLPQITEKPSNKVECTLHLWECKTGS